MVIPEFFTDDDLSCKCGCGLITPKDSAYRLYALRLLWGKPLIINSSMRCTKRNKAVSGSKGSTHLPPADRDGVSRDWGGCGFDIAVKFEDQRKLESLAISCGFMGIGEGKNFIHIDDAKRPKITRWIY